MIDAYRRNQIQAKATAVLQEAGIGRLPVDPRQVAAHFDIPVLAKPPTMDGASGWLIRSGDDFTIIYATHIENVGFQNFSIAHELGHYVLDGHPEAIFQNDSEHASRAGFRSDDRIENEADHFAACLLMPTALCRVVLRRHADGLAAVKALAHACSTSLTAAALRYVEIGEIPAAVVQSHEGRVEFFAAYPLREHVAWAKPLPAGARIPRHSATCRLCEDADAVLRCDVDGDEVDALDWFANAERSVRLTEEAVGLGRYGRVLTLLTLEDAEEEENDEDGAGTYEPRFR